MRYAAEKAKERVLAIAALELEVDAADLVIEDGEVFARGAPREEDRCIGRGRRRDLEVRRADHGTGAALKPFAALDPETGAVEVEPHSAISYAACVADVEVDDETGEVTVLSLLEAYDVGRAMNPTLVEGADPGRRDDRGSASGARDVLPVLPQREHRGSEFGAYLAPRIENLPEMEDLILENPSVRWAVRRQRDRGDGQQRRSLLPSPTAVYDAIGVWITELPITPEKRASRACSGKLRAEAGPSVRGSASISTKRCR